MGLLFAAAAATSIRAGAAPVERMGQQGMREFASTHPSGETRIRQLTEWMPNFRLYWENCSQPLPAQQANQGAPPRYLGVWRGDGRAGDRNEKPTPGAGFPCYLPGSMVPVEGLEPALCRHKRILVATSTNSATPAANRRTEVWRRGARLKRVAPQAPMSAGRYHLLVLRPFGGRAATLLTAPPDGKRGMESPASSTAPWSTGSRDRAAEQEHCAADHQSGNGDHALALRIRQRLHLGRTATRAGTRWNR